MSGIKVATTDALSEGQHLCVEVGETLLALFCVDGEIFAIDNACPHMDGQLSKGDLLGHTIVCPLHAWEFDIRDGKCLAPAWHPKAKDLTRYVVSQQGDDIFVELPGSTD